MADQRKVDELTGVETTGHEWDGISELDNPLPKWWLYIMYACIIWAIGYWVVYPAWPGLSGHTQGTFGYSSRVEVIKQVEAAKAGQAQFIEAIRAQSVAEVKDNPELRKFALAGGESAFGDNCAPCHGSGATGSAGFPNLADDDWLWDGTIEGIDATIRYGIRGGHDDGRSGDMPAHKTDEILEDAQIQTVADYVLSLSGGGSATNEGKVLFEENCASCHGEDGKGMGDLGAPNLTDNIWLYGGDKATVVESIAKGRKGVMPTWEARLDDATIKQLAVYVHSLGGGK